MGEMNRRDLLGAGVALGMGVAASGALGQEETGVCLRASPFFS